MRPQIQVVVLACSPHISSPQHPAPKAFTRHSDVAYVNIADPAPLPESEHCVISCVRADARVYAIADQAVRRGARLTFLVRQVDAALARYANDRQANVLPAAGYGHQISTATQHAAIRRIVGGQRVVANGFVEHSAGRYASPRTHTVMQVLAEASRRANASTRVVAAVLSLHRTGSNFLRDLIGLTVSGNVDVFHEHAVPEAPADDRPSFQQQLKATRRRQILDATRRFIFVCERDPVERLISYFQERHMALLVDAFDPVSGSLRDTARIQRTFDTWLLRQARKQRDWYLTRLVRHFGVGPLDCVPTPDGCFVGEYRENTLIVVPTRQLSALREACAAAFGGGAYDAIAANSITRRGGAPIDAAFRRQIRVDAPAEQLLRTIPELQYVLPEATAPAPELCTPSSSRP